MIALIYGGAFSPATRILEFFAPGFFLLFLDILLGHVIYAAGRGHGFAVAKVASVAVATALNLVLIPHASYFGAALATLVTEVLVVTLLMIPIASMKALRPRAVVSRATNAERCPG